jgi:glucokinase
MKKESIILAGDVGGTKTLLALYHFDGGSVRQIVAKKYSSKNYQRFTDLVRHFLNESQQEPEIAVFGIPGPVKDGKVKSTNLPWLISEKELSSETEIAHIVLLNDLEAAAHAIPDLAAEDYDTLYKGEKHRNAKKYVVIAPGTGLGQAFLSVENDHYKVIASEGGHAGFSPASDLEAKLFQFLHERFGHVSNERIISGSGLPNIFDFLIEIQQVKALEETLEKMESTDRAIVISEMGISGKDPVCAQAMSIFVSVLGSHARNLALTFIPDGGIFLGGGIPFKIYDKLVDGSFEKAYLNAGRMKNLVKSIPVFVINNNRTALNGAVHYAVEQLNNY